MTTALIITLVLIMMQKETTLAIIAIVAALGLLGLVVAESVNMPKQQAEAAKSATGACASGIN